MSAQGRAVPEEGKPVEKAPALQPALAGDLGDLGDVDVDSEEDIDLGEAQVQCGAGLAEEGPAAFQADTSSWRNLRKVRGEIFSSVSTFQVVRSIFSEGTNEVLHKAAYARDVLELSRDNARRAQLFKTRPVIAAIGETAGLELLDDWRVLVRGNATFFDDPRELLLVQAANEEGGPWGSAAAEAHAMEVFLQAATQGARPEEGPWLWHVHHHDVSRALQAIGVLGRGGDPPCWWHQVLRFLHLWRPAAPAGYLEVLEDQFGGGVAYCFAWGCFYGQMFWALMLLCTISLLFNVAPTVQGELVPGDLRWRWELLKGLVILWGAAVVVRGWRRSNLMPVGGSVVQMTQSRTLNPRFRRSWSWPGWAGALVLSVPSIVVLTFLLPLCCIGMWFYHVLYLTYTWGGCLEQQPICRSPEETRGAEGWLAEVSADILLAIVFEIIRALVRVHAVWLVGLRNYQFKFDHDFAVALLRGSLESVERVLAFSLIAFVFVPDIGAPHPCQDLPWAERLTCPCDDLILSIPTQYISCLKRRTPVAYRRQYFERSLKGPFLVAPFVCIILKGLVPFVARRLYRAAELLPRWHGCGLVPKFMLRVCVLIFAYKDVSVTTLRFLTRGQPWALTGVWSGGGGDVCATDGRGDWRLGHRPSWNPALETAKNTAELWALDALHQSALKLFEPNDEMLEYNLNFLWVLCFAQVTPWGPWGVLVQTLSWWIESETDLMKLLYARQKVIDDNMGLLHTTQRFITSQAVLIGLGFSIGLSLVTYSGSFEY